MKPRVLLTFDIEEADIFTEYSLDLSIQEQLALSHSGTLNIVTLLNGHNLSATLFITGTFARYDERLLSSLATSHEIACHGMQHGAAEFCNPSEARSLLQEITGQAIDGFRMPRLGQISSRALAAAGYLYDSSINPTFIPFRYNYLNSPILPFHDGHLIRLPVSVTPGLRFPLFWLSLKNLPLRFYIPMALSTLKKTGYLHLYFHSWEFVDTSHSDLPVHIRRNSGPKMSKRLSKLLNALQQVPDVQFVKARDYINSVEISAQQAPQ